MKIDIPCHGERSNNQHLPKELTLCHKPKTAQEFYLGRLAELNVRSELPNYPSVNKLTQNTCKSSLSCLLDGCFDRSYNRISYIGSKRKIEDKAKRTSLKSIFRKWFNIKKEICKTRAIWKLRKANKKSYTKSLMNILSFRMRGKLLIARRRIRRKNTQHTYRHTYKRMNPNIYKSNVEEKDGKCSYQIQRKKDVNVYHSKT